MNTSARSLRPIVFTMLAGLGLPSSARAVDPTALVTVRATSAAGHTGTYQVLLNSVNYNADLNRVVWQRTTPTAISDAQNGTLVATLQSVAVSVMNTTVINLNCTLRAGATPVVCEIDSILLMFPPQEPGSLTGRATASVSVTDLDGDGARVAGIGPPGTGAFIAELEGAGANFSQLVAEVTVGPFGTAAATQTDPSIGFRSLSAGPSGMASRLIFELSANDMAAATTSFELRNVVGFQLFEDGDLNCDRVIGLADIGAFTLALSDPDGYDAQYSNCNLMYADMNLDDTVTVSDIGAFVSRLLAEAAPSAR
jgi:hypothetical protein